MERHRVEPGKVAQLVEPEELVEPAEPVMPLELVEQVEPVESVELTLAGDSESRVSQAAVPKPDPVDETIHLRPQGLGLWAEGCRGWSLAGDSEHVQRRRESRATAAMELHRVEPGKVAQLVEPEELVEPAEPVMPLELVEQVEPVESVELTLAGDSESRVSQAAVPKPDPVDETIHLRPQGLGLWAEGCRGWSLAGDSEHVQRRREARATAAMERHRVEPGKVAQLVEPEELVEPAEPVMPLELVEQVEPVESVELTLAGDSESRVSQAAVPKPDPVDETIHLRPQGLGLWAEGCRGWSLAGDSEHVQRPRASRATAAMERHRNQWCHWSW
ncbi:uncharacterized protein LOC115406136 [Salarias fasciatus]|uniref:uncharacterized protein LOC115406136 n=1 Tax=Salarias fasciatus TaxID=181472 RepID=UPI001176B1EA|nr:uncharacterized protein LOC115406136 [Salarias fasciatus]